MSDVGDARQGFPPEAICRYGGQILKSLQLGGCEPLTQKRKVVSLVWSAG
jgi:hypothetical protein